MGGLTFHQDPFRVTPAGPASAYETFSVHRPQAPEVWEPATCEDVDCEAWANGWVTRVPAGNEAMVQAVLKCGRSFTEITGLAASEREFLFAAGTPCFLVSTHRRLKRPDTPDLFVVRDGDWRGNPRGTAPRVHQRPEDWVEHFAETTDAVNERIEKG